MKAYIWLILIALTTSLSMSLFAQEFKPYISEKSKKRYKKLEAKTLSLFSRRYFGKKTCFTIQFQGPEHIEDKVYEAIFPERDFYYFKLPESSWKDKNYIPTFFDRKKLSRISDIIASLKKGTAIRFYGTLQLVPRKVKFKGKKYYFKVDDIKIYKDDDDEEGKKDNEKVKKINLDTYRKVDDKELKKLSSELIGEKLKVLYLYIGKKQKIDDSIKHKFPDGNFQQLDTGNPFELNSKPLSGIVVLYRKSNEKVTSTLAKLEEKDGVYLYGVLQTYKDKRKFPPRIRYYFLLDALRLKTDEDMAKRSL